MPLETATYINQLDAANPLGSDPIASGDDHLRLIKSTVKATFPNIGGPVTMTEAQLNSIPNLASTAYVDSAVSGVIVPTAGLIKQIVHQKFTNTTQTTSGSYIDTFSTLSITPTSASSKIIVMTEGMLAKFDYSGAAVLRLVRGSTVLVGDHYLWGSNAFNAPPYQTYSGIALHTVDSPATTSAVTYKLQLKNVNAGSAVYGMNDVDGCVMTLIEVSQ